MMVEISSEKTKYEDLLRHTKSSLERQVLTNQSFLSSVMSFIINLSGHCCVKGFLHLVISLLFRQQLLVIFYINNNMNKTAQQTFTGGGPGGEGVAAERGHEAAGDREGFFAQRI